MSHQNRIRVAAVATALFLGGMTATGLALRSEPPPSAGAPASVPAQTVEEVRTETIVEPAPQPAPPPPPQTRPASSPAPQPAPASSEEWDDDDSGHGRGRGRGRGRGGDD